MRVTSTLQRTVILAGVIALATRTVHANPNPNPNPDPQGPGFGVPFNWGTGGNVNGNGNGNAQYNPAYNNGNSNSNNNNNNGNNANSNNNVNNNSTSGSNAGNALTTNNNENSDSNSDDSSSSNSLHGGGPGSGSNAGFPPFPGSSSSPGPGNDNNDDDDFGEGFGHGGENYSYSLSTLHTYGTAHGALAALAFVFLFPLGGILIRLRGSLPWHVGVQMLGWALYVAGAGLGIYLVSMGPGFGRLTESEGEGEGRFGGGFFRDDDGDDDDGIAGVSAAHPIIGLVLLGVMTLQPVWGYIHHRRFVRATRGGGGDDGKYVVALAPPRRTWPSYLHIWAGRIGITLGIINGGLGLWLADASRGAVIAYSVIAAIIWLVWVLTILVGGREKASARRDAEIEKARSKAVAVPPRNNNSGAGFVPSVRGGTGGHGSETSSRTVASISSDSSRPASSGRDSSIVVGSTHRSPAVTAGVSNSSSSSPYTHAHPNPNTAGAADGNNAGDADAGSATVTAAAAALPPYTPGPNYEAHMAQIRHEQEQQSRGLVAGGGEMQEGMKKAEMERSSSPSILSELQDEMHRGQV